MGPRFSPLLPVTLSRHAPQARMGCAASWRRPNLSGSEHRAPTLHSVACACCWAGSHSSTDAQCSACAHALIASASRPHVFSAHTEWIVSVSILVSIALYPVLLGFSHGLAWWLQPTLYALDMVYLLDILMTCCTALVRCGAPHHPPPHSSFPSCPPPPPTGPFRRCAPRHFAPRDHPRVRLNASPGRSRRRDPGTLTRTLLYL